MRISFAVRRGSDGRLDRDRTGSGVGHRNGGGGARIQMAGDAVGAAEIAQHQQVLADIRTRGYGAWRFDDTHQSLHNRLAGVLASLEPTGQVTRQLTTLMTMVTLQSITDILETELASTEFVVLPIFGQSGQPEYQIEIHLGGCAGLTPAALDAALAHAQGLLSAGITAGV